MNFKNRYKTTLSLACFPQLLAMLCCTLWSLQLVAQNPCDTLISEETLNIPVQDCNALVPICLPIYEEAFLTYDVFDNGLRYTNAINGCNVDTIVAYSYSALLGSGELGPYLVESWPVNGILYNGEFPDIPALVDSMNTWDPLGNWQRDTTLAFTISGGFNDHFYGALQISKPGVSNSTSILGTNYGIQPKGTEIYLTLEQHQLVLIDTALACMDTLQINMACLPTEHLSDVVYLGSNDNFCLDITALPGNLQSISELPIPENAGIASLTINGLATCIDFVGNAVGQTRHLFLACDDLGFCDSTYFNLEVKDPEDQLLNAALAPGEEGIICVNTNSLIGAVSNVDSLCANGDFVEFTYDPTTNCIQYRALAYGTETACYELCDALGGCLLVELEVNVQDAQTTPLAQNDTDTLVGNQTQIIDLVANDIYNAATDSLDFPTLPQGGTLTHLGNGQVSYTPTNADCNLDFFTYRLCNTGGCSIAAVTLNRLCDEINVFSGFSPNGDSRNDFFTIQGVEAFAQSELQVFDRWGVRVFYQVAYQNDWIGDWNGSDLPDGTYYYLLELNDEAKQQFFGYLQIHR